MQRLLESDTTFGVQSVLVSVFSQSSGVSLCIGRLWLCTGNSLCKVKRDRTQSTVMHFLIPATVVTL